MLPSNRVHPPMFRYSTYKIALAVIAVYMMSSCEPQAYKQGKALYTAYCANCHMPDGTGLTGHIPPLAESDYLKADPTRVACIIRYGLADTIQVNGKRYSQPMAAVPKLNEFEITNIINYLNNAWNNNLEYVSLEEVQAALEACAP